MPLAELLRDTGPTTAEALASVIRAGTFAGSTVTVIGYGNMGRQHVAALRALGVGRIRVCTRSPHRLQELAGVKGVQCVSGGWEALGKSRESDEAVIVATPVLLLAPAVEQLLQAGYRRMLVEKPVSLWSSVIERLAGEAEGHGAEVVCGLNRLAYPAWHELAARAAAEGGITSCNYGFTEMVEPDWQARFAPPVLARWGVANSLHVISMAHGLIGPAERAATFRAGRLPWHPSGAVFVGSGMTTRGVPFAYHADWTAPGRWWIEAHTRAAAYRLCPLETLQRRTHGLAAWETAPVATTAPSIKAGILEQAAALLDPAVRRVLPLASLRETARAVRWTEEVFGYAAEEPRAHG